MVDENLLRFLNSRGNANPNYAQTFAREIYPNNISPSQAESIIQNAVANNNKSLITKQGLQTAGKIAPVTGDMWDIYSGTQKIKGGHPFIGGAQTALGVAGLASIPFTLGAGSLAKSGIKAGAKALVKRGIIDNPIAKDIMKGGYKSVNKLDKTMKGVGKATHNPLVATAGYTIPEILVALQGGTEPAGGAIQQQQTPQEESTANNSVANNSQSYTLGGIPSDSMENFINSLTSNASQEEGLPDIQSNGGEVINRYLQQLQNRNALYQKALETYIKNYPKNLEQARRNDLYFYGANLAKGLNPKAGEKFNPLQNQAEIVNLIKSLDDIKNSNVDYANEVAGNMAIANDLGLPNSAAFANKNLLTAYSMKERDAVKQAIANAQIKAKIYGIDEKTALMRELQNLKGQNAIDVAMLYSGMGYPGVGLSQQGTVQQAPVQSIDPRQQFFN